MKTMKKLICILLLFTCLLLLTVACAPKEGEPEGSETELVTEEESVSETEEEGTGLNDHEELDSPDFGPLIPV